MKVFRHKFFLPILLIFSAVSTLVAVYFFIQYQRVRISDPSIGINEIVEKVGRLVVLPEDETPTLATVSDKDKLTTQDFFSKAENGDKVLMYLKAGKAYLYRPQINKIIDIAPVTNVTKLKNSDLETEGESVPTVSPTNSFPTEEGQ